MKYIDLISQFWRMNRVEKFSPYEIALYFYLLESWNQSMRKNPLRKATSGIMEELKMSKKVIYDARKGLEERGLIQCEDGGRHELPKYRFIEKVDVDDDVGEDEVKMDKIPEPTLFGEDKKKKEKKKRDEFVPPKLEEVERMFEDKGVEDAKTKAADFFFHYESLGWHTTSGAKIFRWDSLVNRWMINDSKDGKSRRNNSKRDDGYKSELKKRIEGADSRWREKEGVG